MSAVTQPRMNDREVVRCECGLIQFKAASGLCLKSVCRKSYVDPKEDPPIMPEEVPVVPVVWKMPLTHATQALPSVLSVLRLAHGLSQKKMALLLGCPRTYISKVENAKATPTLSTLERICYALGISVQNFLYLCENAS